MTQSRATQENSFSICGKILDILPPQKLNDKLTKSSIILAVYTGQYENQVPFDFFNKNALIPSGFKKGDWVLINFQLRGRKVTNAEGKTNYYGTNDGINCILG